MACKYVIGIDPGQHVGFAMFERASKRLTCVETLDFWSAYESVCKHDPTEVKIVIEVHDKAPTFWQRKARAQNQNVMARMGVNVGQVIEQSSLLAEGLKRAGYHVITSKPLGKKTQEEFKRLTGWAARTNQHERDAGVLCWGL